MSRQTSLTSWKGPPPLAKTNSVLVSEACARAFIKGQETLELTNERPNIPYVHGEVTYFGEQMFSWMATGSFKPLDVIKGKGISVALRDQGFDVIVRWRERVYRVEVKTIYKNSILPLSGPQRRIATLLAIFNPRESVQNIEFDGIIRECAPLSYHIIRL